MVRLMMPSSIEPELGVRAGHAAPVIIATDGRAQSDGALTIGRLFASAAETRRLVTALKPIPVIPDTQLGATAEIDAARRAAARRDAITQVERVWGNDSDVELLDGDPATAIARFAHRVGATMIVAGLGRHRVSDRVFGDETALRLIRLADVPVFAATEGADRAPRRIVIAVDFSETSLRAARLAIELAALGATIYLVHVAPRDSAMHDWKVWGSSYKQDAGQALKKLRSEMLRLPEDMIVQDVLLQGDAATELLRFAASVDADLIATGSHGHGFVARMLIGSVATRVVRCSTCSVLVVPHAAVMTRVRTTVEPPHVDSPPSPNWATALDDFTRRNMGRRATLEVDDPEIGAQAQEFDYPLLGATFDHHDRRVELMVGDGRRGGARLTRTIADVSGVDLLRDERGRDIALRVSHGPGQTLLTFTG